MMVTPSEALGRRRYGRRTAAFQSGLDRGGGFTKQPASHKAHFMRIVQQAIGVLFGHEQGALSVPEQQNQRSSGYAHLDLSVLVLDLTSPMRYRAERLSGHELLPFALMS